MQCRITIVSVSEQARQEFLNERQLSTLKKKIITACILAIRIHSSHYILHRIF